MEEQKRATLQEGGLIQTEGLKGGDRDPAFDQIAAQKEVSVYDVNFYRDDSGFCAYIPAFNLRLRSESVTGIKREIGAAMQFMIQNQERSYDFPEIPEDIPGWQKIALKKVERIAVPEKCLEDKDHQFGGEPVATATGTHSRLCQTCKVPEDLWLYLHHGVGDGAGEFVGDEEAPEEGCGDPGCLNCAGKPKNEAAAEAVETVR